MKKLPLLQTQSNSTTFLLPLPDLHKVKVARRSGALQLKVGEVQHNLPVDLHNDLEDTVPIVGVVIRVVGWTERPCRGGEGLTTVWWERERFKQNIIIWVMCFHFVQTKDALYILGIMSLKLCQTFFWTFSIDFHSGRFKIWVEQFQFWLKLVELKTDKSNHEDRSHRFWPCRKAD